MDGNNTQDPQQQNPQVPPTPLGTDTTQNSIPSPVPNPVQPSQQEESQDAPQQPPIPSVAPAEDEQPMQNPIPSPMPIVSDTSATQPTGGTAQNPMPPIADQTPSVAPSGAPMTPPDPFQLMQQNAAQVASSQSTAQDAPIQDSTQPPQPVSVQPVSAAQDPAIPQPMQNDTQPPAPQSLQDTQLQPSMPQPVQDSAMQPPMSQSVPETSIPSTQNGTQQPSVDSATPGPELLGSPAPEPGTPAEPAPQETVTPQPNDTVLQPQPDANSMTPPEPSAPQAPVSPEPTAPEAPASPAPENPPASDGSSTATQPTTESLQATVSLPDPDPAQQNATAPSMPSHKGGFNWLLILSLVLLVLVALGGAYMYMLSSNKPAQETVQMPTPTTAKTGSPTSAVSLTPVPSGTVSASLGKVAGTMCYPASGIPAGIITAKDTTTGKEYTQTYAGTGNGAAASYTFDLPVGAYHLKFTPTQYSTVVGYYTDYSSCVGNPSGANCQGQKVRPLLTATVSANLTVQNVNLCDYYYPTNNPPQF